jgi:ribonuclease-3
VAGKRSLVAHVQRGALSLAKARSKPLAELSERLGHVFSDPSLLDLALTHSSARATVKIKEDNERLEFLGDRVLGLAIAELLTRLFPEATEGELALWYNYLVRADTCGDVAIEWDLGRFIVMSGGKAGSAGRRILGNACEAVLGAIFLDGGYEAARTVVQRFWMSHLSAPELAGPHAKSALQEWAQGRRLPLPRYLEIAREGPDHAPRFTVEVQIDGVAPERGYGASKQAAEQAAALAMLRREGVWQANG